MWFSEFARSSSGNQTTGKFLPLHAGLNVSYLCINKTTVILVSTVSFLIWNFTVLNGMPECSRCPRLPIMKRSKYEMRGENLTD